MTRGLGPCGPGGVSVPLRLARTASHRHSRRRVLPHAFCLAPEHPDSVDAARILDRVSPQAHDALGATARSCAAVVALRTRADGVEGAPTAVHNTVDYFRTGVKDVVARFGQSRVSICWRQRQPTPAHRRPRRCTTARGLQRMARQRLPRRTRPPASWRLWHRVWPTRARPRAGLGRTPLGTRAPCARPTRRRGTP